MRAPGGGDAWREGAGQAVREGAGDDVRFLERAVELGRRGWGRVHPNPMVGCVLVRGGRIVGEGWHEEFGDPHAEVRALERAGEAAEGATAYVSLEPCRHQGKTPPCTRALERAGVARVVYGAADPGSESGEGGRELREAGLEVTGPLLDERGAFRENPAFLHEGWTGRSYVALKLALTLDGRIARRTGERTAVSGAPALHRVQALRAGHDAVMVGAHTARVDDPLLTVREPVPMRKHPTRIVLDPQATLPTGAALFRDVDTAPLVVFVRDDAPEDRLERLEEAGAAVHPVNGTEAGLDVAAVLDVCHRIGLLSILCEGGGRLASSLLAGSLISRMYLFLAPRALGESGVPAFAGPAPADAWSGWLPSLPPEALGPDVLVTLDRPPLRSRHPGEP